MTLEPPTLDDGQRLWALARISGLDLNSPYAYVLWCRDFAATSLVARDRTGTIRGFVTGYVRPEAPDTYFLWQIAVDPAYRGRRLAAECSTASVLASPSAAFATSKPP